MKRLIALAIGVMVLILPSWGHSTDVLSYWRTQDGIGQRGAYRHLLEIAKPQFSARDSALSRLTTREDWESYIESSREKFGKIVGELPARTPLNAVIVGRTEKDGIIAEKFYYESMPGYKVPAVLFRPAKVSGRLPAVLYCCGHIDNGFRYENYQTVMLNLAKKGFAVMSLDPAGQGERKMTKMAAATHEHSYCGVQAFACGYSPALYFICDAMRAIDYLQSRNDIDGERIGVTGRSGGGTQSAYIAAIDPRVKALATENYVTSMATLLASKGAQDGEQNFIHAVYEGFDNADLLTMRAPKPTLMVVTYNDIFPIHGTMKAYEETRRAFTALGAAENLEISIDYGGHQSTKKNNEAIYAFFQKHLGGAGDPSEDKVKHFDEKHLSLFHGENFMEKSGSKTLSEMNLLLGEDAKKARRALQESDYRDYLTQLPEMVKKVTGANAHPAEKVEATLSGRLNRERFDIEQYLVKGCGNYFTPVLRVIPHGVSNGKSLLYLDDKGKHHAVETSEVASLAEAGYTVVIPDLSGTGETGTGYIAGGDSEISGVSLNLWHASILVNHSMAAIRMAEIAKVAQLAISLQGTDNKITAQATGAHCADLLQAATVYDLFGHLTLTDPLESWQSIVGARDYDVKHVPGMSAGVLRHYDIPDLINYMATQGIPVEVRHKK